jgi:hypothetical protein
MKKKAIIYVGDELGNPGAIRSGIDFTSRIP